MTKVIIDPQSFEIFCNKFEALLLQNIEQRCETTDAPDWFLGEVSSVLGGLMSRQATLALSLAQNPSIWNPHIAPLILRAMIDAVITYRWIIQEPKQRSQKFIGYGLGQAKLSIAHYEKKAGVEPEDSVLKTMISFKEAWITSQRLMPFVEVNLGSWSGKSVRQMAKEAGDEEFYNFSFTPFSSCVHNQWDHIHIFNTTQCDNPLHKWHRYPAILDTGLSDDFVFRAAKYFDMVMDSFDQKSERKLSLGDAKSFYEKEITSIYTEVTEPIS